MTGAYQFPAIDFPWNAFDCEGCWNVDSYCDERPMDWMKGSASCIIVLGSEPRAGRLLKDCLVHVSTPTVCPQTGGHILANRSRL
jgi:hypothetical protein